MANTLKPSWIQQMAQLGLSAKGLVYIILGTLAFMAAFEIGGHSNQEATSTGALSFVQDAPAGAVLLGLLMIGLFCYVIWRLVQTFTNKGGEQKDWKHRLRYLFSGLAYFALALTALQLLLHSGGTESGDQNQQMAGQVLSKPMGQWLLGIAALLLAGIGIYQIYYGFSGKYKKHLQNLRLHSQSIALLVPSGKVGYIARGIVWLIIAYLLLQAALHANAAEAGNTSKAFQFLEGSPMGSYLLGALGLGLVAYGVFNFLRAKYERFD
ncbi:MAG TPA: DUF1206 domain-containing protein [Flavisolibacter sp.]|nr:DUF1206 domain-containing protein [Flavisolibacter sp.]